MTALLERWVKHYPIFSIEDGLAEDDWDGWRKLTAALGGRVQLIGDDLFVTNPARLQRGIDGRRRQRGAGEGEPDRHADGDAGRGAAGAGGRLSGGDLGPQRRDGGQHLADLAVATGAGQIKIGSVARSERLAKYNQLLRIEEEMGSAARFAGW